MLVSCTTKLELSLGVGRFQPCTIQRDKTDVLSEHE